MKKGLITTVELSRGISKKHYMISRKGLDVLFAVRKAAELLQLRGMVLSISLEEALGLKQPEKPVRAEGEEEYSEADFKRIVLRRKLRV